MHYKSGDRVARGAVGGAVLGVALALGACSSSQPSEADWPSPEERQRIDEAVEAGDAGSQVSVTWDCDGTMIPVRFMNDAMLMDLPDGTSVTLPLAMSGSGSRYTNGTVTYWEHQRTARIETPTESWEDCTRRDA